MAFAPLSNSTLRLELARTFAVAAIARTRAMSLASNRTLGLGVALVGFAVLDGRFMPCLRSDRKVGPGSEKPVPGTPDRIGQTVLLQGGCRFGISFGVGDAS